MPGVCLEGPLFIGVADELFDTLRRIGSTPKAVILRRPLLDASAAAVPEQIVTQATATGRHIIVSGVQAQSLDMHSHLSLGTNQSHITHCGGFPAALCIAAAIAAAPIEPKGRTLS